MDARILLLEDDADLRAAMAAALTADGHAVDAHGDGRAALEALAEGGFEVVLLDIALGAGLDGIEVCRRLRAADDDVYVMMLTARDGEANIVLALEAGADDYVVKPVGIVELRSRVRAALRRVRRTAPAATAAPGAASAPPAAVLRHDTLTLDPGARLATVDGRPVDLTRSELAVLEALMRADGTARTRAELTQAIYGDDAYRDPRNIDVHMHHLRDKLEAAGGKPAWVTTVRGTGYRLSR